MSGGGGFRGQGYEQHTNANWYRRNYNSNGQIPSNWNQYQKTDPINWSDQPWQGQPQSTYYQRSSWTNWDRSQSYTDRTDYSLDWYEWDNRNREENAQPYQNYGYQQKSFNTRYHNFEKSNPYIKARSSSCSTSNTTKKNPSVTTTKPSKPLLGSEEDKWQKITETAVKLKKTVSNITNEEKVNFWDECLKDNPIANDIAPSQDSLESSSIPDVRQNTEAKHISEGDSWNIRHRVEPESSGKIDFSEFSFPNEEQLEKYVVFDRIGSPKIDYRELKTFPGSNYNNNKYSLVHHDKEICKSTESIARYQKQQQRELVSPHQETINFEEVTQVFNKQPRNCFLEKQNNCVSASNKHKMSEKDSRFLDLPDRSAMGTKLITATKTTTKTIATLSPSLKADLTSSTSFNQSLDFTPKKFAKSGASEENDSCFKKPLSVKAKKIKRRRMPPPPLQEPQKPSMLPPSVIVPLVNYPAATGMAPSTPKSEAVISPRSSAGLTIDSGRTSRTFTPSFVAPLNFYEDNFEVFQGAMKFAEQLVVSEDGSETFKTSVTSVTSVTTVPFSSVPKFVSSPQYSSPTSQLSLAPGIKMPIATVPGAVLGQAAQTIPRKTDVNTLKGSQVLTKDTQELDIAAMSPLLPPLTSFGSSNEPLIDAATKPLAAATTIPVLNGACPSIPVSTEESEVVVMTCKAKVRNQPKNTEITWKSKVINKFLSMSANEIRNMIDCSSRRKHDFVMDRLVKEQKISNNQEIRMGEDEKLKYDNQDEFIKQVNAMLDVSATFDINDLPTEFVQQLNDVMLNLNFIPAPDPSNAAAQPIELADINQEAQEISSILQEEDDPSINLPHDQCEEEPKQVEPVHRTKKQKLRVDIVRQSDEKTKESQHKAKLQQQQQLVNEWIASIHDTPTAEQAVDDHMTCTLTAESISHELPSPMKSANNNAPFNGTDVHDVLSAGADETFPLPACVENHENPESHETPVMPTTLSTLSTCIDFIRKMQDIDRQLLDLWGKKCEIFQNLLSAHKDSFTEDETKQMEATVMSGINMSINPLSMMMNVMLGKPMISQPVNSEATSASMGLETLSRMILMPNMSMTPIIPTSRKDAGYPNSEAGGSKLSVGEKDSGKFEVRLGNRDKGFGKDESQDRSNSRNSVLSREEYESTSTLKDRKRTIPTEPFDENGSESSMKGHSFFLDTSEYQVSTELGKRPGAKAEAVRPQNRISKLFKVTDSSISTNSKEFGDENKIPRISVRSIKDLSVIEEV